MMSALWNKTKNVEIAAMLHIASNIWTRNKGLLGRASLPQNEAMLIHRCNSIHTFFMKFPIDVVFINKNYVVKKIVKNVRPGRIVLPVWSALHAIEFAAGNAHIEQISVGDQLHVDS